VSVALPPTYVECAPIEESSLFGRTFDGFVACGLLFLLAPEVQRRVIAKVAPDSISLGYDGLPNGSEDQGLTLLGTGLDEGDNHYYLASKPVTSTMRG
jgi:hypothetical protein